MKRRKRSRGSDIGVKGRALTHGLLVNHAINPVTSHQGRSGKTAVLGETSTFVQGGGDAAVLEKGLVPVALVESYGADALVVESVADDALAEANLPVEKGRDVGREVSFRHRRRVERGPAGWRGPSLAAAWQRRGRLRYVRDVVGLASVWPGVLGPLAYVWCPRGRETCCSMPRSSVCKTCYSPDH